MTSEDFEKYVREDAERWFAVHARIDGVALALQAVLTSLPKKTRALIARRLLQGAEALSLDDQRGTVMAGELLQIAQGKDPTWDSNWFSRPPSTES